jgi:hypothetical protein
VAILRVSVVTVQPGVARGVTEGMITSVGSPISTFTVLDFSLSFGTWKCRTAAGRQFVVLDGHMGGRRSSPRADCEAHGDEPDHRPSHPL